MYDQNHEHHENLALCLAVAICLFSFLLAISHTMAHSNQTDLFVGWKDHVAGSQGTLTWAAESRINEARFTKTESQPKGYAVTQSAIIVDRPPDPYADEDELGVPEVVANCAVPLGQTSSPSGSDADSTNISNDKSQQPAKESYEAATVSIAPSNRFPGIAYVGRWSIPDIGCDVACYSTTSQEVCDASDAAIYIRFGDTTVIGDHRTQAFSGLKNCEVGTMAYLATENGTIQFVCVKVDSGHNGETGLTDENYNTIATNYNPGGIVCYTCQGKDWHDVYIMSFQPVDANDTTEVI